MAALVPVWIACLAAVDGRPWIPALAWVTALAGLVALFDRFYLTFNWLAVEMVFHHLHTLLLVYLPPIVFAILLPWRTRRREVTP